jgi:hypothetical protein
MYVQLRSSSYKCSAAFCSLQQIVRTDRLEFQFTQKQINVPTLEERIFCFLANDCICTQDVPGSVDAVMYDLNVLEVFVLDRQHRQSLIFGPSLYLGSVCFGDLETV